MGSCDGEALEDEGVGSEVAGPDWDTFSGGGVLCSGGLDTVGFCADGEGRGGRRLLGTFGFRSRGLFFTATTRVVCKWPAATRGMVRHTRRDNSRTNTGQFGSNRCGNLRARRDTLVIVFVRSRLAICTIKLYGLVMEIPWVYFGECFNEF